MPITGINEQDIITEIIVEPDKNIDELLEEGKSFKEINEALKPKVISINQGLAIYRRS